jgi:hypothetical protein
MTKRTVIILSVAAGVLIAGSLALIIYGQDKQRKRAYSTPVPPGYALEQIRKITAR